MGRKEKDKTGKKGWEGGKRRRKEKEDMGRGRRGKKKGKWEKGKKGWEGGERGK